MNTPGNIAGPFHQLQIDRLSLTNFRRFKEVTVDFHPEMTVLVAGNGQGKTAILDAVAIALGPFVGAFDDGKDRPFLKDDIRRISVPGSNRVEMADGGVALHALGEVGNAAVSWKRQLAGPKSRTTRREAGQLMEYGKQLQGKVRQEIDGGPVSGLTLPLVAHYSTARLWNIRRLPYKKLSRTSRMVGYTHCLESGSDFHLVADWLRYWSTNALTRQIKAQQAGEQILPSEFDDALEAVREAVNICLKPAGWRDVDFSLSTEEIVARHDELGELPVGMLSDGIRNVLTLVADIAFRAVKLNPNLGPYAAKKVQGIVLIDEVDMHLHPSWQQTILGSLRSAFPNIQFIVTTHSPQVLTSVDSSSIRILGDEEELDDGTRRVNVRTVPLQTKGVASSDLLAEIMGVNPVPDVPEARMLSEYHALIQQNLHESQAGLALRLGIDIHFGGGHPVVRECDRMIRLQGFKQKLPIPEGRN